MLKRNILIKPFNNKVFYKNGIFAIDNNHNPFYKMDKKLEKMGVVAETIDVKDNKYHADLYVYCDTPYPWELRRWMDLLSHPDKNILFVFESPVINPINHLALIKPLFSKIYTWNDDLVDNRKYFKFFITQRSIKIHGSDMQKKQLAAFMVSNNPRVSLLKVFSVMVTKYKETLYKERNRIIEKILSRRDSVFFGKGWQKKYRAHDSFGGEISEKNKYMVIGRFRFYFAVENCVAPGYITEKIFDAFRSGAVPVYLGAKNVSDYIPESSFVDYAKFNNIDQVFEYLKNMENGTYNSYLASGKRFYNRLLKDGKWFERGLVDKIIENLNV